LSIELPIDDGANLLTGFVLVGMFE